MRLPVILIFCVFLANCANVQSASSHSAATPAPTAVETPREEIRPPLVPVKPNLKLDARQQKYLDQSLPPQVREILEKAESFEIQAEVYETIEDDKDWMTFQPNRVLKVSSEKDKREVLEAFYSDASKEDAPAICFYPRHVLRAVYQEKIVEVVICFSCSRFTVKSEFGTFQGTIARDDRKSEDFLAGLLKEKATN